MKIKTTLFLNLALGLGIGSLAAQDADAIIAQGLKAIHAEKLASTRSVRFSGTASYSGGAVSGTFTWSRMRPDLSRFQTEFDGNTLVQAYDGQEAWAIIPTIAGGSGEPETLPAPQAKFLVQNAAYDAPMMTYKEQGHRMEMVGREEIEGKPAMHLKLVRGGLPEIHYYLNASDYLLVKQVQMQPNPATGGESEVETWPSDYREVDGVLMAHRIQTRIEGNVINDMMIEKIEFNVAIDRSLFQRPREKTSSNQD